LPAIVLLKRPFLQKWIINNFKGGDSMTKLISALRAPGLLLLALAAAGCTQHGTDSMDKSGMEPAKENSMMDSTMEKDMDKMDSHMKKGM
jgi:hypothetical protein